MRNLLQVSMALLAIATTANGSMRDKSGGTKVYVRDDNLDPGEVKDATADGKRGVLDGLSDTFRSDVGNFQGKNETFRHSPPESAAGADLTQALEFPQMSNSSYENYDSNNNSNSSSNNNSSLIPTVRFVLEGILVAAVAHCGIFGNLLSLHILLRKKLDLQPFLTRLLVLLVTFDTVFLAADFLTYSLPVLSPAYHDRVHPILAPRFLIPLTQIALTGSVYSIVAVTVERYVSCCFPLVPAREGALVNVASLGGIVLFSIVYNVSRFFEFEAVYYEDDDVLEVDITELRRDANYVRFYLLAANCTVMVLVPLVSLVFLNWKIHGAIRRREKFRATLTVTTTTKTKQKQRNHHLDAEDARNGDRRRSSSSGHAHASAKEREVTIGQILIAIVTVFFICHTFKVVVVGFEVIMYLRGSREDVFPDWIEIVINLNHVALAFNAAINIVIYICKDKKFRAACLEMFPFVSAAGGALGNCRRVRGGGGGGGEIGRRTRRARTRPDGGGDCGGCSNNSTEEFVNLTSGRNGHGVRNDDKEEEGASEEVKTTAFGNGLLQPRSPQPL